MTESESLKSGFPAEITTALESGIPASQLANRISAAPEDDALQALKSIVVKCDDALPVLQAVALANTGTLAVAAAEAMGSIKTPESARLLVEIDASSAPKLIKKAARRSLHKLRTVGIVPAEEPATVAAAGHDHEVSRALITSIDGAGNRLIWLIRGRPFGGLEMVSLLVNDKYGIVDASGTDTTVRDFEDELERKREVKSFAIVDAPVDYALWLAQEARTLNRESGTALPKDFHAWRRLVTEPVNNYERPAIYEHISATEIRLDPMLIAESPQLLAEPETITWYFDWDEIQPFVDELRAVAESRVALPTQTKEERAQAVIARALTSLFNDEVRQTWKRRLEEMAYVFWLQQRVRTAKLALAAAVGLENDEERNIVSHPFLNAMFEKSAAVHLRGDISGLFPTGTGPDVGTPPPGGSGLIIPG